MVNTPSKSVVWMVRARQALPAAMCGVCRTLHPLAEKTSATTFIDTAIDITLTASDSDPVTFEVVEQPANGSVQFVGPNIVRYTPDSGITGQDHFTFRAGDGQEFSELATVNILVNRAGHHGQSARAIHALQRRHHAGDGHRLR